jgi:hypothetical protein
MASYTDCQTPGAIYELIVEPEDEESVKKVGCIVTLPRRIKLTDRERDVLEANMHNAMELVLARFFQKR